MKNLTITSVIALFALTIFSCSKTKIAPTVLGKVDTSTVLAGSSLLVGNWNVAKDSVFFNGASQVYHGLPGDHYKFTKYSNLYVHISPDVIDTAIYNLNTLSLQVSWTNLYYSASGVATTTQSTSFPFTVATIDDHNLVLVSDASTQYGRRYEQLTFTK